MPASISPPRAALPDTTAPSGGPLAADPAVRAVSAIGVAPGSARALAHRPRGFQDRAEAPPRQAPQTQPDPIPGS
jgi:hypothetical protein